MDGLADIEYYEAHGPATEISRDLMCTMQRLILEVFSQDSQLPRTLLLFNHAETVAHYLNYLDIWAPGDKPGPETWSNPQRLFRGARDIPFSANIALELWNVHGSLRVRTLLNEVPVYVPSCHSYDCSLEQFGQIRANITSYCDINAMCSTDSALHVQESEVSF